MISVAVQSPSFYHHHRALLLPRLPSLSVAVVVAADADLEPEAEGADSKLGSKA